VFALVSLTVGFTPWPQLDATWNDMKSATAAAIEANRLIESSVAG